jgi:hypothetical protein
MDRRDTYAYAHLGFRRRFCVVEEHGRTGTQGRISKPVQWRALLEKMIVSHLVKKSPTPFKWNAEVHRVYNSPLLDPILSQLNPSHPNLLGSVFLFSFNLRLGLPRLGLFTSCSLTETLYAFLICPMCAACPVHLIHLCLISDYFAFFLALVHTHTHTYVFFSTLSRKDHNSSFSILTTLRTGEQSNCGSIPGTGKILFSSPQLPDQLWGLLGLLSI